MASGFQKRRALTRSVNLPKPRDRGITFIEVLMTVIIISVSVLILIQGVSHSLLMLRSADQSSLAAHLARQKLAELELKNFEIGSETSGTFTENREFSWAVEIRDPAIPEAKDFAISEVFLKIHWLDGNEKRTMEVITYTAKIQKLQE